MWIVTAQHFRRGTHFFATFCFDTWQEANDFWKQRNKGFPGMMWLHASNIKEELSGTYI